MSQRRMILNAFTNFAPTHHDHGQWKRPGAGQLNYNKLDYWLRLARLAERGKLDSVFIVDAVGVMDTYENSPRAAIREATLVPQGDPTTLISAMASVTSHIAFGITISTSYENPYFLARRMNSLDHLTNGRIGWNIVTSFIPSGATDLGIDADRFAHDRRYDVCDEFMQVAYKLWEGSWEDGANVRDQAAGVYADPSKVHPIEHNGEFYHVKGIAPFEPSPQRTPFLYQAGTSPAGRRFAARHAEAIFMLGSTPESTRSVSDTVRSDVAAAGRDAESVPLIIQATIIVGATDEEARARAERLSSYATVESGLAGASSVLGIDLSQYDLESYIDEIDNPNVVGFADMLKGHSQAGERWTVRRVAEEWAFGGPGPTIVGSPTTVADEMERWMDVGGIDGFNLVRLEDPESLEDFIDLVVPVLQARGRMWTEYPEGTMRQQQLGGSAYTHDWHPASACRGMYAGQRSAADRKDG